MGSARSQPEPYLGPSVKLWPARWRLEFEERAAIMEFDGGLTRENAENEAEALIRAEFERCYGEDR